MKFPRIYTDEQGETHLEHIDLPEEQLAMGPPPNPVGVKSSIGKVDNMFFFSNVAGLEVPLHPAPQPYIGIVLSGEGEIVASDGGSCRLLPGSVIFLDDTTGKGHITRTFTDMSMAFMFREG